MLLSAQACGGVRPAHPVLAAVVEMIHTATLVHDDILDEAVVRRHAATVNAEWGNEAAVLLGDYLFTHAFHLASSLEIDLRLPADRPARRTSSARGSCSRSTTAATSTSTRTPTTRSSAARPPS